MPGGVLIGSAIAEMSGPVVSFGGNVERTWAETNPPIELTLEIPEGLEAEVAHTLRLLAKLVCDG
jgi:hypothetical protein